MSGFISAEYNVAFQRGWITNIVDLLIKCSDDMKSDCLVSGRCLKNNENAIRNRLCERYLTPQAVENALPVRFITEAQEGYIENDDSYMGRSDIRVIAANRFAKRDDYFVVECKRIDGGVYLNNEYVKEGVCRFATIPVKYASPHGCNIMFGFIVKFIDISENARAIKAIQDGELGSSAIGDLTAERTEDPDYHLYNCAYLVGAVPLELKHLFYDFSQVI